VRLRLTARARAALRGRSSAKATLSITLTEGGVKRSFQRGITLRRSAGPSRLARSGLKLWAGCAESRRLNASLTLSSREARRLGLKPKGSARYELAARQTTCGTKAAGLTLKVKQSARSALSKARRVAAQLETVVGAPPDQTRAAKLPLTLRR
jgi:hypothetical protein